MLEQEGIHAGDQGPMHLDEASFIQEEKSSFGLPPLRPGQSKKWHPSSWKALSVLLKDIEAK